MTAPLVGEECDAFTLGGNFTQLSALSESVHQAGRVSQVTVLCLAACCSTYFDHACVVSGDYRDGQADREEQAQEASRGHIF